MKEPCRRRTTSLSHPMADRRRSCGHLSRVARRSHWLSVMPALLAAPGLTGCIIPEAPEYGAPPQTPVFVEADSIFPNPTSLQHYQNVNGTQADFRMTVRSEDAGEQLISVLYLDYKHKNGHYIDHKNYKPLTFDKERVISWTHGFFDPTIGQGPECHSFTVTVFHDNEQSWDSDTNTQIGTPPDMASVTWFASFNDDGTGLLADCPSASTEVATTPP